ncbi:hypothetical protein [Streptomyces roseochromogenus]|uniref:hypothetical protein n=1 Tax=Streptomyces roseochromogenus TaxID=285450 RepID=UPI000A6C81D3|nr:hypothetical protein [Streptomyces roseochromogenus]
MTDTPGIGTIVKDTDTGKIGRIMGFVGSYVQLRPLGGGREWDAKPEHLELVRPPGTLNAQVAEANARSRRMAAVVANTLLPDGAGNPGNDAESPSPSAECALARRPGYEELHHACIQTQDIPLPGAIGILLTPRCDCPCHTGSVRGHDGQTRRTAAEEDARLPRR